MEVLALVLPSLQLDSVLFSSSSRSRRGKLLSPRMPANEVWCLWKTWQTPSQFWSRRGRGAWGTSSFSSTLASRFQSFELHFADVNIFSWGTWHIRGWTTSTSEGSSHGPMRTAWSPGITISGGDVLNVFDKHNMCFPRSYTAIGDVIALFVILPLLVRSLQLHDLSIVIIAVLSQVRKLTTVLIALSWVKKSTVFSIVLSILPPPQ